MSLKKTAAIIAGASVVSYGTYRIFAEQLFNNSFIKKDHNVELDQKYTTWFSTSNVLKVNIESFDGLKLNAYNVHNHENNKYVILIHGYHNNSTSMYSRAYELDKLGYNTLIIDQRAAGESEGNYYTFGFKESLDLVQWINYLTNKYPDVKICLFGVSMGATTAMLSTRNALPDNVKCIVEDCGYSSAKEQFDHVLHKTYNIVFTKIILKILENRMSEKLGLSFEDLNAKSALKNNNIPIMFIHGIEDDYVPYEMAVKLYNHNAGTKKIYPVASAGHTEAINNDKYFINIDQFISQYLS